MKFEVTIWTDDMDFYLKETCVTISEWARVNCPSYINYDFLDMSDFNSWDGPADSGYRFSFGDEQDALLFSLKWL